MIMPTLSYNEYYNCMGDKLKCGETNTLEKQQSDYWIFKLVSIPYHGNLCWLAIWCNNHY